MKPWTGTVTITRTWMVPIDRNAECVSEDDAVEYAMGKTDCGSEFDDQEIEAVSDEQLRPEPERS